MMRRVCFVLPSLAGGGAERVAVTVLNGLDGTAWERSLYLFKREGPYLADVAPGIEVASGDSEAGGRVSLLRRFFQRTNPDVIVTFLSYVSVLAAARLARSRARIVFNLGTPPSAFLDDRDYGLSQPMRRVAFRAVSRLAYRRADLILATSAGVRDDIRRTFDVDRSRVRVVHNPIDLERIQRAAGEPVDDVDRARWTPPVVVAAGRLAEAKNMLLLVDAFARLHERRDARLFILGEGDHESALRTRIAERRLADCVVLCGFKTNPWRYMAKADVFALTSRYEGFGNVLVEAMASGVPVVATASAGTREVVADGVNGLLVEPHTPEAVAAALERVLADRVLRHALADGARASAPEYAVPKIVAEYHAIFQELAA
jgi:glycosyltransferase involved in cell wall biosynthesis